MGKCETTSTVADKSFCRLTIHFTGWVTHSWLLILLLIYAHSFGYLFPFNRFLLFISARSFLVTRSWNLSGYSFVTIPVATKINKGLLLFCGNVKLPLP